MSINARLVLHFVVYLGKAGKRGAMPERQQPLFQPEKGESHSFHEVEKIYKKHCSIFYNIDRDHSGDYPGNPVSPVFYALCHRMDHCHDRQSSCQDPGETAESSQKAYIDADHHRSSGSRGHCPLFPGGEDRRRDKRFPGPGAGNVF